MSVIVSGPRRVYVVLLFCQRVAEACSGCPRLLVRVADAVGTERSPRLGAGCRSFCRQVFTIRLQRILWRRLIGISLLVLDPRP